MLCRSAPLPRGPGWAYEPKWDGFRALVSVNGDVRVRSRRGWDMTALVPELAAIDRPVVLDGELVAFDADGKPSQPRLCRRLFASDRSIAIVFVAFDVLTVDGHAVDHEPYRERRCRLEALNLGWPHVHVTSSHADGAALWDSIVAEGLEGVVAKRLDDPYRPGERRWIKRKNPDWWRLEHERESMRARGRVDLGDGGAVRGAPGGSGGRRRFPLY
jgi:bifunctional non-homologous end joining protein LigD